VTRPRDPTTLTLVPATVPPLPGAKGVLISENGHGSGTGNGRMKLTPMDVIKLVAYVLAFAMAYSAFSDKIARLEERYSAMERTVSRFESDSRERMNRIEGAVERIAERRR
jgi:hypothetical protein